VCLIRIPIANTQERRGGNTSKLLVGCRREGHWEVRGPEIRDCAAPDRMGSAPSEERKKRAKKTGMVLIGAVRRGTKKRGSRE